MAKTTELLKEYVKSYNAAIGEMAEYHSSIIKRSDSIASFYKIQNNCKFSGIDIGSIIICSLEGSDIRIRKDCL